MDKDAKMFGIRNYWMMARNLDEWKGFLRRSKTLRRCWYFVHLIFSTLRGFKTNPLFVTSHNSVQKWLSFLALKRYFITDFAMEICRSLKLCGTHLPILWIFPIARKRLLIVSCDAFNASANITRFTSLCKIFTYLSFSRTFWCHVHHFQCMMVPVQFQRDKHWKWWTWHRKASAKNSSKWRFWL